MRYAIFSERSFAALIRPNDPARFKINLQNDRDQILHDAVVEANSGNPILSPYRTTTARGKKYVSYDRFADHLALRAIVRHLARRYRITINSRDEMVQGVVEGLMDATPMYIVRRDIKSFYESISVGDLKRQVLSDTRTSRSAKQYIEKFFSQHCGNSGGLPRGVGLSAVLAELHMQQFDISVQSLPGVYRYYRYSDDIFIFFLNKPGEIDEVLTQYLPSGMKFNVSKSVDYNISQGDVGPISGIEYLGYRFVLSGGAKAKNSRKVEVGIGERKISRLKARIYTSFEEFLKNNDFKLLRDRLRYLSSNYIVYRNSSLRKDFSHVKSGIFYNYKLCGVYSNKFGSDLTVAPSSLHELKEVDGFYHALLRGPSSRFSSIIAKAPGQAAQLARISFYKGHSLRMLVRYRPHEISLIKRAWRHV